MYWGYVNKRLQGGVSKPYSKLLSVYKGTTPWIEIIEGNSDIH